MELLSLKLCQNYLRGTNPSDMTKFELVLCLYMDGLGYSHDKMLDVMLMFVYSDMAFNYNDL